MRAASIDIGTNSVLLTIAERRDDGTIQVLLERATITRLGEGVDATGKLAPAAIERTLAALRSYEEDLRRERVTRVSAVATSAARDGDADGAFVAAAEAILSTRVQIITGLREAELTFRGALVGLPQDGDLVVVDIGGGSTEVVLGRRTGHRCTVETAQSLQLGSVRVTERHFRSDPPQATELMEARLTIATKLHDLPLLDHPRKLIGVAGTVTTAAAVHLGLERYNSEVVHGREISLETIQQLLKQLSLLPLEQRRTVKGLSPQRADVIVGGLLILEELLRWAQCETIVVSDRGVRWGLLAEQLPPPSNPRGSLPAS